MSLFDAPLTFVNNEEDNYQQASDSEGCASIGKGEKDENGGKNDAVGSDNDNSNESSRTSVLTRTKSVSHHIRWEIDDRSIQIAKLATKADKRGVIEATVIKDGYDFKLELCASGWRSSQDGYCAFYLTVPNMTDQFVARYRVQFGNTSRVSSIRHDFQLGVGFPNFCHQDTLDSCVAKKLCLFNIVIEIFNCESNIKLPLAPLCATQPHLVLANLMRDMYYHGLHCDVKLVCQGHNMSAHKVVLSHASPVFKAMFSHNLYENNSNQVNMVEWDPQIVQAFIKYLYTAEIDLKASKNKSKSSNDNRSCCSFYRTKTENTVNNSSRLADSRLADSSLVGSSLVGLDEIDIDESKAWSFHDIFEKKEENSQSVNDSDDDESQSNSDCGNESGNESGNEESGIASSSESGKQCENENQSLVVTPSRKVNASVNDEKEENNSSVLSSTSVIEASLNTVSIVDMSEQCVGSPCAIRFKRKGANTRGQSQNVCDNVKDNVKDNGKNNVKNTHNRKKKKTNASKKDEKITHRYNSKLANNRTFKLFEIAEFYKVTNLVIACCQKMHREIQIDTACDLLIRIHRYDHVKELKQIQECVWLFVSNNIRTIMLTDGYKYVLAHYPHLLGQLIEKITN